MKKLVYTAVIAFWAAIGTLVVLHALGPETDGGQARPEPDADQPVSYPMAEVARHDSLEDCWMVIEGVIYDLSEYVPRHPAPPDVLEPWCGREATEGMRTKSHNSGGGSDHSARAWRMLERYRIGLLQ